jgi:hypothetical protein
MSMLGCIRGGEPLASGWDIVGILVTRVALVSVLIEASFVEEAASLFLFF